MNIGKNNFIQTNSPDGGFLQSENWRKFQESVGRKTFNIFDNNFYANIIEHELPVVGKYFYIPRGPIIEVQSSKFKVQNYNSKLKVLLKKLINLAKENNIGWIRFDPLDEKITELIHELIPEFEIKKAPHDMQPKEVFIIDITKPEEQLLAEMKPKTRYNIKLAQKHGVKINVIHAQAGIQSSALVSGSEAGMTEKYINEFLRLTKLTAKRDSITPHPDSYYRKMLETIPAEKLKLYVAEYNGKIIAANLVSFYGNVATYLHGASDSECRQVMAPYLLQWQQILDAKEMGCEKYDLGGIKSYNIKHEKYNKDSWSGITRFKLGFSMTAKPTEFAGSYDIVINPLRYNFYRIIQSIKALF